MIFLDLLFRVGGTVLLIVLAALALRDIRAVGSAKFLAMMALGLSGYLFVNSPQILPAPQWLLLIAGVLSQTVALFLWWFSLSLFDDDFRLRRFEWIVAAVWLTLLLISRGAIPFADPVPVLASWARVAIGVLMVCHIIFRVIDGSRVDLVEERRRKRSLFATIIAVIFLVDLVADIAMGFAWRPLWFSVTQNGAAFLLVVTLVFWLTKASAQALTFDRSQSSPTASIKAYDTRLEKRLSTLINEGVFLEPDLSIGGLAQKMEVPEHQVRALINGGLGYRNFRAFLNEHRLATAKATLSDPAKVDEQILTIAMDSGFASLASFNRTFKLSENMTPSDYRAAALEKSPENSLSKPEIASQN